MKKLLVLALALMMSLSFACAEEETPALRPRTPMCWSPASQRRAIRPLAEYAAAYLNADLFRIEPAIPYTDADLNYNDADCRANQEMNDETSRPTLAATVENMAQYDTVVLAFPIWWGQAPRLIETFVEAHDLSGKTVLIFCTSASSGYGRTGEILAALTDGTVNWIEGARFSASTTAEEGKPGLRKKASPPIRRSKRIANG